MGFQPSPGAKAGCDVGYTPMPSFNLSFQPSPGAKAGCDHQQVIAGDKTVHVSTLTRRESRVRQARPKQRGLRSQVSTLTRRESRVRLERVVHCLRTMIPFQPSPGAKAGCDIPRRAGRGGTLEGFNPHPARKPGATHVGGFAPHRRAGFNPHPARKPGATPGNHCRLCLNTRFNPHPARKPGATS